MGQLTINDLSENCNSDWALKPEDYPYTGKGFTDSGKIISNFKYDIKFGWFDFN